MQRRNQVVVTYEKAKKFARLITRCAAVRLKPMLHLLLELFRPAIGNALDFENGETLEERHGVTGKKRSRVKSNGRNSAVDLHRRDAVYHVCSFFAGCL